MATTEEIDELRAITLVSLEEYSQTRLSTLIDAVGINASAASIWRQKAAQYSALVDVSESGSSRSMSQLYKNAVAQAEMFQSLADKEAEAAATAGRTRTRVTSIERA